MNQPQSSIKIAHFNTQSAQPKKHEIIHFIHTEKIDVLCLNETWLNEKKQFKIPNYKIIRLDRQINSKGGVLIAIHESITSIQVKHSFKEECIIIKLCNIINNNTDLQIAAYYNPPNQPLNETLLQYIFSLGNYTMLIGDLNAHHPIWNSNHTNQSGSTIYKLINDLQLCILNDDAPTYEPLHRPNYTAILDLAIASQQLSSKALNYQTHDEPRSDHLPITITIDANRISNNNHNNQTNQLTINKINWSSFQQQLNDNYNELNTLPISTNNDIDNLVNKLTNTIQEALNKATTIKTINKNPLSIYLPKHILHLIKQKKTTRKLYQKTKDPLIKTNYNKLAETIKKKIIEYKQSKWQKFCDSLNTHLTSDSKLWNKIHSINNRNEHKPPKLPEIFINNTIQNNPTITTNAFADHLESTFKLFDGPQYDQQHYQDVNNKKSNFFNTNITDIKLTNEIEIENFIKKLKNKSAPGKDTINNKLLKQLPSSYYSLIAKIFNTSITNSHIPSSWKHASIIVLPKPNKDPNKIDSYRPISLLNTLSKLLERVIYHRIELWIIENKILSKFQSGFRRKRQTKDHIFRIIQQAQSSFNQKMKMGAVFVDLERAFDSVWHDGLLFKLNQLNIPAYLGKWIQNYLDHRTFQVKIGSILSTIRKIEAGVPQGSVLGPLLFILFFNDIPTNTDTTTTPATFADDLSFWYSHSNIKAITNHLQSTLDKLKHWLYKWRMKLNIKKTTCIIFNRSNQKLSNQLILYYNNERVQTDTNPKFLGVTLDHRLAFNQHLDNIKTRCEKRINMLKCIRGKNWGANSKLCLNIYKVFIRPIIDYIPFLPLITTTHQMERLEIIHRKAIRTAFQLPPDTPKSDTLEISQLLSIRERCINLTDKYVQKAHVCNELIKETIKNYIVAQELNEGAFCGKYKSKTTILGAIKSDVNMQSSSLIN